MLTGTAISLLVATIATLIPLRSGFRAFERLEF
jgi:hypothetical protein